MSHTHYVGSGPYCYANALAMMLGENAPSPAIIEFATSSAFGAEIVGENLAFFDPYGWTPLEGIDGALKALGWESTLMVGMDEHDALGCLKDEVQKGPVFVGPVEMGYLTYQPGNKGPIGADHYVVVLQVCEDIVELHDPHGHPYASLPVSDFMMAWRANTLGYGQPYMMRTNFRRVENISEEDVIRRSISVGLRWLSMEPRSDMPPGSAGNHEAVERLAKMIEKKYTRDLQGHLVYFAVRVGARRAADAASCLARVGCPEAAGIMAKQARFIGSLQYPLVKGDTTQAARILRMLAPTYEELRESLIKREAY
ncbi:hypothetical protein PT974_03159 [Cladobotryum mycophilum]|uniref:RADC family protein n=1 Tax=Cladobotryum mycophilum TaxID=491253 RepID=A0ABR0SSR2_9HYPO